MHCFCCSVSMLYLGHITCFYGQWLLCGGTGHRKTHFVEAKALAFGFSPELITLIMRPPEDQ